MHRTTIILDEGLERRLKKMARREGKTLTDLIQDFLRGGLNRIFPAKKRDRLNLPSFSMGEPLVDPADRGRLWDILDEK